MDFPRTVEEITPEWLTQVLRENGAIDGASVSSVSIESFADQGISSFVNRLLLEYSGPGKHGPASLFSKLAFENEAQRERQTSIGVSNREVQFYRQLATTAGIASPKSYFAEYDDSDGFLNILLEDAGHLRTVDQSEDCSFEDADTALGSAAKMHARWWGDDRLNDFKWLIDVNDPLPKAIGVEAYNNSIDKSMEILSEWAPASFESIARKYGGVINEIRDQIVKRPRTLVHGDYRLGNLLFNDSKDAVDPIVAFDWQNAGHGNVATDVSHFFIYNLDTENRRRIEKDLIDNHYRRLVDAGVTGLSKGEFEDDLRYGLFNIIGTFIFAAPRIAPMLSTDEGTKRVAAICKRFQIFVDWNVDELMV